MRTSQLSKNNGECSQLWTVTCELLTLGVHCPQAITPFYPLWVHNQFFLMFSFLLKRSIFIEESLENEVIKKIKMKLINLQKKLFGNLNLIRPLDPTTNLPAVQSTGNTLSRGWGRSHRNPVCGALYGTNWFLPQTQRKEERRPKGNQHSKRGVKNRATSPNNGGLVWILTQTNSLKKKKKTDIYEKVENLNTYWSH